MSDCLKLTAYFGERARADGAFTADALVELFARHRLETSLVLRGVEGFGAKHQLRTDRLLTLSEDLPMVAVAVDGRERIEAALADVRALPRFTGLVTTERARMLGAEELGAGGAVAEGVIGGGAGGAPTAVKVTIYVGRQERAGGRPAHLAVVDLLRRSGIAGATVLLGVDGTRRGARRRARFFARNAEVPVMVIALGDADRVAGALPELGALLTDPLVTLERVTIAKRDGALLARPPRGASDDDRWQKLMVYASSHPRHGDAALHRSLVAALRHAGAPGATTVRGIWGYSGDHRPHGDRLLQVRRHVPMVTTLLDRPEAMQRWFEIVDRATTETGLVTSERVAGAEVRAG